MQGGHRAAVDGVTDEVSVEGRLEGKWEAGSCRGGRTQLKQHVIVLHAWVSSEPLPGPVPGG